MWLVGVVSRRWVESVGVVIRRWVWLKCTGVISGCCKLEYTSAHFHHTLSSTNIFQLHENFKLKPPSK